MAESDRDIYRRDQANLNREKLIMKDVEGWEVSTSRSDHITWGGELKKLVEIVSNRLKKWKIEGERGRFQPARLSQK